MKTVTVKPPMRWSKTGEHGPLAPERAPSAMQRLRSLLKLSVDASSEQVLSDAADELEHLMSEEVKVPTPKEEIQIKKSKREVLSV